MRKYTVIYCYAGCNSSAGMTIRYVEAATPEDAANTEEYDQEVLVFEGWHTPLVYLP